MLFIGEKFIIFNFVIGVLLELSYCQKILSKVWISIHNEILKTNKNKCQMQLLKNYRIDKTCGIYVLFLLSSYLVSVCQYCIYIFFNKSNICICLSKRTYYISSTLFYSYAFIVFWYLWLVEKLILVMGQICRVLIKTQEISNVKYIYPNAL